MIDAVPIHYMDYIKPKTAINHRGQGVVTKGLSMQFGYAT